MKAQDLYIAEQPVMSLVEGVCVRPGMYTLNGTLEEAAAFLEGFYSGMASHNLSEGAVQEVTWWSEFCKWACEQLGNSQSGWYGVFRSLRSKYSDDSDAFGRLAELCLRYRRDRAAG